MKLVSLAVAAALGGASFASISAPLTQETERFPERIVKFQQLGELDQAKQRLARHGITEKNRPFLFRSLEETLNRKANQPEMAGIMSTAQSSDCQTGKLCSFFKHMGLRSMTRQDGRAHV